MGITNSLGAYQAPLLFNNKQLTPQYADFLQTQGSAATTTNNIIAKESAQDTFHLTFLSVVQTAPTANAFTTIYCATATVLGVFATGAVGTLNFNFGPVGLKVGNTDTYSVYALTTGGTSTVSFVATGYRLK